MREIGRNDVGKIMYEIPELLCEGTPESQDIETLEIDTAVVIVWDKRRRKLCHVEVRRNCTKAWEINSETKLFDTQEEAILYDVAHERAYAENTLRNCDRIEKHYNNGHA